MDEEITLIGVHTRVTTLEASVPEKLGRIDDRLGRIEKILVAVGTVMLLLNVDLIKQAIAAVLRH